MDGVVPVLPTVAAVAVDAAVYALLVPLVVAVLVEACGAYDPLLRLPDRLDPLDDEKLISSENERGTSHDCDCGFCSGTYAAYCDYGYLSRWLRFGRCGVLLPRGSETDGCHCPGAFGERVTRRPRRSLCRSRNGSRNRACGVRRIFA